MRSFGSVYSTSLHLLPESLQSRVTIGSTLILLIRQMSHFFLIHT